MTLIAVLLIVGLFGLLGLLLETLASRMPTNEESLVLEIEALLPQTQCAQCGFPGCRPYAEAIARHEADINQCPPGGDPLILALADLLGREPMAADETRGRQKDPAVAVIDEPRCIGCALCLKACPVDAILGASRYLHTVIADECTGCELCIPSCPVDCIEMVDRPAYGRLSR
jgi:Na+-translocating ferredoxin:NAD+ oxidoreductase subunit B